MVPRDLRFEACPCILLTAAVLLASSSIAAVESVPQDYAPNYAGYIDILRNPELLSSVEVFQRLMQHKHSLSRGSLQRSLVYKGANLRLSKVVEKLQTRGHVSVGVIGGSISWGHMVKKNVEDWFTLFAAWMNTTFPAVQFKFRNGCVPATQSEYVSMCLKHFVEPDVDLIFVEYATNDGYTDGPINNARARAFERLLRKLLQHENGPAVCLMQFMMTDAKQKKLPFYATGEDAYGVLAQYYGLPWLSYRNAVWHGLMSNQPGFSRFEIFPPEDERHPTPLGHMYLADIAINLIQQTYVDSVLAPMTTAELKPHLMGAQVPSPMFSGNYESSNLVCIIGDQLQSVVMQHSGNWTWMNDGTQIKPKWGYASWEAGATLVLKVDTRARVTGAAGTNDSSSASGSGGSGVEGSSSTFSSIPDMIIWVGYLKSWRHMGSATMSCIQGCQCQTVVVDAMHLEDNTQQHMAKLFATQAEECLVAVQINSWAQTQAHRFKVTGIMVSHRIDYNSEGDFTETMLLDSMGNEQQ